MRSQSDTSAVATHCNSSSPGERVVATANLGDESIEHVDSILQGQEPALCEINPEDLRTTRTNAKLIRLL
jgi:hypothetical protein